MKKTITYISLLASFSLFAQIDTLTKQHIEAELKPLKINIDGFQKDNIFLKNEIRKLHKKLANSNEIIDSLKAQTQVNNNNITQIANELGQKIITTTDNNQIQIREIEQAISKKSLYAIIGILFAFVVSLIVYLILTKKQKSDKTEVVKQLSQTKTAIEESLIKEFEKQTDLIDSQLHILEQQKAEVTTNSNQEIDHSLALKVANEINLIERNINLMNQDTKGLKQLSRSVRKLKDNLAANGYEIPELLSKQFHQGMKVIVTSSIPDENLEKGDEIITKVLIPQVNYNDKMIQTAQIEVSVGI